MTVFDLNFSNYNLPSEESVIKYFFHLKKQKGRNVLYNFKCNEMLFLKLSTKTLYGQTHQSN